MTAFLTKTLTSQYNLDVSSIKETAGGWSASAFDVHAGNSRYFVKVYDKQRPSVQHWIRRMALYLPVVLWLSESTPLRDHMIAPLPTTRGSCRAENDAFALLVFPYVSGTTLGDAPLTHTQTSQLAATLALLHSLDATNIPLPIKALEETYALPFAGTLSGILSAKNLPSQLQAVLEQYAHSISNAVTTLQRLAAQLRGKPPRHVLCHADLHGWNLMWDGRLRLIDWEGLLLAPAEADLFSMSSGFFFAGAQHDFFPAYQAARPAYVPNQTAMNFYRLRRRLEDIAEFCHSIAYDSPSPAEAAQSLIHLQQECAALDETAFPG